MTKTLLVLHDEFRHALDDGLGPLESARYELTAIEKADGRVDVGAAFCVEDAALYALVNGAEHKHDPSTAAEWMLELAKDLSRFFRTFVVPAQTSHAATYWGGKTIGPIIAYKFKLIDRPSVLRY